MSSLAPFDDARTLLNAAALGVTIHWPNDFTFTEPAPLDASDNAVLWLAVDCTGQALDPVDIGANVWQEEGTLYVNVMAPAGTGSDDARTLAKNVANVFRNLGPRNVVYLGASIGTGVIEELNGKWWCLPVSIDWRYQDTTS